MTPSVENTDAFTVLVTLRVPEDQQYDILCLAENNLHIFAQQQGFISAQVYYSHDKTRVLTLLQWETQAAHEACMQSPDWAQCDPQFIVLLDKGTMSMDVRTYQSAARLRADA